MILLQAQGSWVQDLVSNPALDSSILQTINTVQSIALGIAIFLYIVTLGWNYAKTSLLSLVNNDSKFFDIPELLRTIVIIIVIMNYSSIAQGIDSAVSIINKYTKLDSTETAKLQQYTKNYVQAQLDAEKNAQQEAINKLKPKGADATQQVQVAKTDNANMPSSKVESEQLNWFTEMNAIMNSSGGMTEYIFHQLFKMLHSIIAIIVQLFAVYTFKLLLILGSLAFAFSIIPSFRNQIDVWFGALLNVGFTFTTLNILDHVVRNVYYQIVNERLQGQGESSFFIVDIMMTLMYLMVPWITSKYVGKGDAGRIMSKGVGLATMAAVGIATAGAGAGAAGAGAGGGSAVSNTMSNAQSASADLFKDNENE